jgi:hypothetical protein
MRNPTYTLINKQVPLSDSLTRELVFNLVEKNYADASLFSAASLAFGFAAAVLARALSFSLSLELPNDPRQRLPLAVLLSPRPIGVPFIYLYILFVRQGGILYRFRRKMQA